MSPLATPSEPPRVRRVAVIGEPVSPWDHRPRAVAGAGGGCDAANMSVPHMIFEVAHPRPRTIPEPAQAPHSRPVRSPA